MKNALKKKIFISFNKFNNVAVLLDINLKDFDFLDSEGAEKAKMYAIDELKAISKDL